MTTYERGDVVLVPFPFTDQSSTKKRPAAVISSNNHNKSFSDIVIIAVTSQIRRRGSEECLIADWRSAGLLKPSAVKPVISSIETRLVLRKLGRLSPEDCAAADDLLRELLNLPLSS
ncbi:MAG: type II toxin-antitoxin system PemK/MazF family toxin [Candidatus Abyssobacteria bacterium SURF_5]|uniref:Type II toxin-antitoxin system PemK/MazF family toxin n=1 Tax=Abyssobacteria bacterium (strain SURF_5) TaxID=2093360 RepID=A0A3A4NK73_ABYX5|nr:MAG: type II toxin-antitoxin system PemK/MazF family toxin [Candidatus Abyssubacteria bacterium SURF_5]